MRDEPTEGETEPAAAVVKEEPMETSTSEVPPTPEVPSTETALICRLVIKNIECRWEPNETQPVRHFIDFDVLS